MVHADWLTRLVLLAACTLLVAGCGSAPEPPPPAPKPSIKVSDIPRFPVRVLLHDKVLATYDRNRTGEDDYTSTAEIKLDALPETSAVTAQQLHPDGWKDGVAQITRDTAGPNIWVTFKEQPEWKIKIGLMVDNRGGGATEIFVGQLPRTIKAGGKDDLFYPAPTSAEHAVVRMHSKEAGGKESLGKEIGTLWPVTETSAPDWGKVKFFIDVTGKRSYRYREVYYSTLGFGVAESELLQLKPEHGELRGNYLHRVPFAFSFFLEKAPDKIEVKADPSKVFEIRTELVEE